ncbi:MAG TPA: hypothetical protein PK218_04875 [Flavobacterium sp.]|jgi:hypothetical protein|uniref:hypothetical protein n=1 Tax=Flavobacterium sp. TaxID=239 RepID=UPI002C1E1660|nr:hypothetical protein [Flavobacterium sp.]HPW97872.1 hypothetical protein [Flavobacterium sp.]HQA74611.1 hypothetical protein [Flavobacterium sp.]
MKTIKSIVILLVLTSFSQMNAQKILDKWEDLNTVNQIYTKVAYVANEGNFEVIGQYTTLLKKYSEKLDTKSIPAELVTPAITEMVGKLKSEAAALDEVAQNKGSKQDVYAKMKPFGETLNILINSIKTE